MIPKYTDQVVDRGGDQEEEMDMVIDKDSISHILFLLRSSLYANKVASPIREYASNAVDAHGDAGLKHLPIEIHIPTNIDPYFRVIDKGAGLTETEMDKVFRRFGKSTKRANNDAIGCLGIGAKSAFAYTDTFLVTSKTVRGSHASIIKYNCYLDETKIGKIGILDRSENPNKETGVTIEVPVDPSDNYRFEEAVFEQTAFFNPAPLYFKNDEKVENPNKAPTQIVDGVWKLASGGSKVVMGGVAYPISETNLKVKACLDEFENKTQVTQKREKILEKLLSLNLVFEVPIGCVEMQASREELSYTPQTTKAILSRFYVAYHKIKQAVVKEISSHPTVIDAIANIESAENKYGLSGAPYLFNGSEISPKNLDFLYDKEKHNRNRKVYASVTLDSIIGPTEFEVNFRKPRDYGHLGKKEDASVKRTIIPVLHDLPPFTNAEVEGRVTTIQKLYPGARVIVYNPTKYIREAKDLPKQVQSDIYEQFKKNYLNKIILGFGFSQESINKPGSVTPNLDQLIHLFRSIGGFCLSEVAVTPRDKSLDEPKDPRLPRAKPLPFLETISCIVYTPYVYNDILNKSIEALKGKEVLYWIFSDGYCYGTKKSDKFKIITGHTLDRENIKDIVNHIQNLEGKSVVMIKTKLTQASKVISLLPSNWKSGRDYLEANIDKLFPPEAQYYMKNDSSQISTYYFKYFLANPNTSQQFKKLKDVVELVSLKKHLRILLLPHLNKDIKVESNSYGYPEYRKVEVLYDTPLFSKAVLQDPLKDFPLLFKFNNEYDMIAYANLVLVNKELEEKVSLLEAQLVSNVEMPDLELV